MLQGQAEVNYEVYGGDKNSILLKMPKRPLLIKRT
jgi:hypothetical protein